MLFLFAMLLPGIGEAAVTLNSRSSGSVASVTSGDYVVLGTWGENDVGTTPLLWETVELEEGGNTQQLWIASRHVHNNVKFNNYDYNGQEWSTSNIRTWLNGTFKTGSGLSAYSGGLLKTYQKFLTTEYVDIDYSDAQVLVEADSEIFLLSVEEMNFIYTGNIQVNRRNSEVWGKMLGYSNFVKTWTRSPVTSQKQSAWRVGDEGFLAVSGVSYPNVSVRPASFLDLGSVIFKSGSEVFDPSVLGFTPSDEAGKISNPFLLYTATDDLAQQSVGINGLTLTINLPQKMAHACTDTKDESALGSLFTVMSDTVPVQVDRAVVNGDTVTLTLATPVAYGDTGITVEYAYAAGDTQGIGFLDSLNNGLPTVWKGLGASPVTVTNNTPTPNPNPNPGGGDPDTPTTPVTGITLNQTTLSLATGGTSTLTATVVPSSATNKSVTWKSSDTDVATVNANGKITAVGPGTCTITATTADGGKTATCEVTVTNVSVTGVTLTPATRTLKKGESFRLTATVAPDNATNKNVTWSSSNTNFATVDVNGKVTGVAAGTVVITVKTGDGEKTATCTVTVTETEIIIDLSDLGLENGTLKLAPGQEVDVTIVGTPAGLKFKATGLPEGLTLTEDGRLTGKVPQVGKYSVTLTVTAPDGTEKTASFTVEVTEEEIIVESDGGGGCNAGIFGFLTLTLAATLPKRR